MYRIAIIIIFIIVSQFDNNINCGSDEETDTVTFGLINSEVYDRMAKARPGFGSKQSSGRKNLKKETKMPIKLGSSQKIEMGSKLPIKLGDIREYSEDFDFGEMAMKMNDQELNEAIDTMKQKSEEFKTISLKNKQNLEMNFKELENMSSRRKLKLDNKSKKLSKTVFKSPEMDIWFEQVVKVPKLSVFNFSSKGSQRETTTEESKTSNDNKEITATEEIDVMFNMTSPYEFIPEPQNMNSTVKASNNRTIIKETTANNETEIRTETTLSVKNVETSDKLKSDQTVSVAKETKRMSRIKRPES